MSYLTKFKHLDLLFKLPSSQKLFYLCFADFCFAPPFGFCRLKHYGRWAGWGSGKTNFMQMIWLTQLPGFHDFPPLLGIKNLKSSSCSVIF